jgi:hypothetical protein
VRSTNEGAQTAGGSVIIRSGGPGVEIITSADESETHPTEFVTVKKYNPPSRPDTVKVLPNPAVVTLSGKRVRIQVPLDGNPLKATLPVGTLYVGCVMVPTIGAVGVGGCAGITAFADGIDRQRL